MATIGSVMAQMRRCVGVGIAVLAVFGCSAVSANAEARTSATVYRAFTARGVVKLRARSRTGYCWEGSATTPRRDAWRCFVGNYIHDPCFSSARHPGIVVCPDVPWRNTGVKIGLTRPLPRVYRNRRSPSARLEPWALELLDGRRCLFASGATNVVEDQRLNYFCGTSSHEGLWGQPDRRTEPWTILTAPFQATQLNEHAQIRHAWM